MLHLHLHRRLNSASGGRTPCSYYARPRAASAQQLLSLETTPLPLNTHGVGKAGKNPPFTGTVVSNTRMGGRDAERDVHHIIIHTGGVLYHEGQSFGVVPPGKKVNARGNEVPETCRLYSIADHRYGPTDDGQHTTLCVVRVVYRDPETGEVKRGLCSNYLADAKPGEKLTMTGPNGTVLLLPPNAVGPSSSGHAGQDSTEEAARPPRIVCVATGTGIAPFRSFWRRLFSDCLPQEQRSQLWLLAGFANPASTLYEHELRGLQEAHPARMRLDIALSSNRNKLGGVEYVQDRIAENADEFMELLQSDDAHFYFCGLKRMYSSSLEVLERCGAERGLDTTTLITRLKHEKRWHVETA